MRKNQKITMNIGIISFLVVFVILCLVTFSVLSLSSAQSNNHLTDKSIAHKNDYYQLCNQGETYLKKIDEKLYQNYQKSSSSEDYYSLLSYIQDIDSNIEINSHTILFQLIQGTQKLSVELEVIYPGEKLYQVKSWKIESSKEWKADTGLNVL